MQLIACCFLAAILSCHLTGVSASESTTSDSLITSLSAELAEIQRSLFEVQQEFLEVQQQHGELHKAHAVLQVSHDSLQLKHNNLQLRLSQADTHDTADPDLLPGADVWLSTADQDRHAVLDDRRALSADGVCDNYGDAHLVVEGTGVFTDDLIIAVGGQRSSVLDLAEDADETASVLERVFDWLCLPISDADVAKTLQTLDVINAKDAECFKLGDMDVVAIAIYNNGGNYHVNSSLYEYNDEADAFELLQEIATTGAFDVEHFSIGDEHFLAFANNFNGSSTNVASTVFKYNNSTALFEEFQQIDTFGATEWEYFRIGSTDFLAVANGFNSSSPLVSSVVYRYNAAANAFVPFQNIPTTSAQGWEHFSIADMDFFAVPNYFDGNGYRLKSVVYRYNQTSAAFQTFQEIDTFGAISWKHFVIEDVDFLAVANHFDSIDDSYSLKSVVYKYNAVEEVFDVFQEIDTIGAIDWEHFHIGDTDFLAVANSKYNSSSTIVDSVVDRYNNDTSAFESMQEFSADGAADWEFFVIGDLNLLALSSAASTTVMLCDDFCF